MKLRIRSQCQQFVLCEEEKQKEEEEEEEKGEKEENVREKGGRRSMKQRQEQDKSAVQPMEVDPASTISPPLDFSLPTQPTTAGETHSVPTIRTTLQFGPLMVCREKSRRHCSPP